jgi:hypothetical protein
MTPTLHSASGVAILESLWIDWLGSHAGGVSVWVRFKLLGTGTE